MSNILTEDYNDPIVFTSSGYGFNVVNNEDADLFYLVFGENEERDEKRRIMEVINSIVKKYLNPKEQCLYYLVVYEQKKTADIQHIVNYNGWRTTQNSIDRMFKILEIYYEFEQIDSEILNREITRNFSKLERKVILFLEKRFTIHQINDELGKKFHYTKTHFLIKNIMSRLADDGGVCRQYYDFLIKIRKFKDSCRFDQKEDDVKFIDEPKEGYGCKIE